MSVNSVGKWRSSNTNKEPASHVHVWINSCAGYSETASKHQTVFVNDLKSPDRECQFSLKVAFVKHEQGTCITRACLEKLFVLAVLKQPANIRQYL